MLIFFCIFVFLSTITNHQNILTNWLTFTNRLNTGLHSFLIIILFNTFLILFFLSQEAGSIPVYFLFPFLHQDVVADSPEPISNEAIDEYVDWWVDDEKEVGEGNHAHEPDGWTEARAAPLDLGQHHAFENVQKNSRKRTSIIKLSMKVPMYGPFLWRFPSLYASDRNQKRILAYNYHSSLFKTQRISTALVDLSFN